MPLPADRVASLPTTVHARGQGWLHADLGHVRVNYMDGSGKLSDQLAYIEAQAAIIDRAAREGTRSAVLNYSPAPLSLDPVARRKFGAMLADKREALRFCTLCFVLVTPSSMVRGVMTAVLWLAPPPYPHSICHDMTEGLRVIQEVDARVDVPVYEAAYRDMLRAQRLV